MEYFLKRVYFVLAKGNAFTIVCASFLFVEIEISSVISIRLAMAYPAFKTILRISKLFVSVSLLFILQGRHLTQFRCNLSATTQGRWSALGDSVNQAGALHGSKAVKMQMKGKGTETQGCWINLWLFLSHILLGISTTTRSCTQVRPERIPVPIRSHVWAQQCQVTQLLFRYCRTMRTMSIMADT